MVRKVISARAPERVSQPKGASALARVRIAGATIVATFILGFSVLGRILATHSDASAVRPVLLWTLAELGWALGCIALSVWVVRRLRLELALGFTTVGLLDTGDPMAAADNRDLVDAATGFVVQRAGDADRQRTVEILSIAMTSRSAAVESRPLLSAEVLAAVLSKRRGAVDPDGDSLDRVMKLNARRTRRASRVWRDVVIALSLVAVVLAAVTFTAAAISMQDVLPSWVAVAGARVSPAVFGIAVIALIYILRRPGRDARLRALRAVFPPGTPMWNAALRGDSPEALLDLSEFVVRGVARKDLAGSVTLVASGDQLEVWGGRPGRVALLAVIPRTSVVAVDESYVEQSSSYRTPSLAMQLEGSEARKIRFSVVGHVAGQAPLSGNADRLRGVGRALADWAKRPIIRDNT